MWGLSSQLLQQSTAAAPDLGCGVSPLSCSLLQHRAATQDDWVMVESSDKMWSTGEGNGKPLQYSYLENPMNSMKRQKDRTLKDEILRLVGAQYDTGDLWRNNSRNNEEMEPKQKITPSCGCDW